MDNTEILARLTQLSNSDNAGAAQLAREIADESSTGGESLVEQWDK
jgi:hypothetical protein